MENLLIRPYTESKLLSFRISPAVWLTLTYLSLSIFWILGSDWLAINISGNNKELFEKIQAIKGLVFVGISAIVLFILCKKFYNDLQASFQQTETLQAKYNAVNEAAREGLFDCDLTNMTAQVNNKMHFFFPVTGNEVKDFWEKYQKRIHPDDINRLLNEFETIVASGKSTWLLDYQLLGMDNRYYSVISSVYIIRDAVTGEATRLIGALQDVTELRNLQAETYEKQLRYKQHLTDSVIAAQETERERWACELHDNVCQILGIVKLHLSDISLKKADAADLLPEVDKTVSKALDEIRQLSCNIKPPSFGQLSLTESIETLAANVNRFKHFDFSLNVLAFNERRIADQQKLLIYRIVQEQLNNIIKYAQATNVIVKLRIDVFDKVHVEVCDNGCGFDTTKVKNGIGLRNIAGRLEAYKGQVNIQSAPGRGCSLSASFSL